MTAAAFSADWLQQREPFDTRARAASAASLGLATWLTSVRAAAAGPCRVVDLACGTGANLRALLPGLGGGQQWRLVDHDPGLLAACPAQLAGWAARHGYRFEARGDSWHVAGSGFDASIELQRVDLAREFEAVVLAGTGLVTASALLDLVGAPWLQRLIDACAAARAAVLFALTVEGPPSWVPAGAVDADDAPVTQAFQAHQSRDKGFGAALGPAAAAATRRALQGAGYTTASARSDWVLAPAAGAAAVALQRALIDGIAAAAAEQAPDQAARTSAWRQRRHALAARATMTVGHLDIIGTPRRA